MHFLIILLFALCAAPLAAGTSIVSGGAPEAVIVLPEKAALTEEFAVEQLSYWIKEITGCSLDIVRAPSKTKNNIYIGRSFAEKKYADDLR